jgi:hypothetical protein
VRECLAVIHHGWPMYEGAHAPHLFTYGPYGMYAGHCGGRTVGVSSSAMKCPNCDEEMREDEIDRGKWYCDACGYEEDRR